MTDINDDKAAINLIDKLFELLNMEGTTSFDAWKDYANNVKEIIKKEEINENDIRDIIEYFDFFMENPYYAETLTLKTGLIMYTGEQKNEKENKLKSYRSAIKIKKKILNYFIKKKNLEENARIICHVNNIDRWLLEDPPAPAVAPAVAPALPAVAVAVIQPREVLNFKEVKDYEKQNKEWRNEIIRLINMGKEERKDYEILTGNEDLLTLDGDWRNYDPQVPSSLYNPKQADLSEEDKTSMTFLTNLLKEDEMVHIAPIKKCNSSVPVSGKSIFTEKKCVEIAEYADQFCVKFTGKSCDEEVKNGGRKKKSKRRRKKSRKYLRRKRRESRRKELKRIRKSKKKLLI